MKRSENQIEQTGERRHDRRAKKIGAAVLATVVSLPIIDSIVTGVSEPFLQPHVEMVRSYDALGRQTSLDCRDADSIVLTASSMGLQVSDFMGANIAKDASEHRACVMKIDMGTYYDQEIPERVAEEIISSVKESEIAAEQPIPTVFWGESWGTNLIQRTLNTETIKRSNLVEPVGFIAESGPSGMESVRGGAGKLVIELNKLGFKPGRETLGAIGLAGMIMQYGGSSNINEMFSVHFPDARKNNDATSPRLVGDQGKDIGVNGFPRPRDKSDNTVPVYSIAWQGDPVVDNEIATREIKSRLNAPLKTYEISGLSTLNHAACWVKENYDRECSPIINKILDESLPQNEENFSSGINKPR